MYKEKQNLRNCKNIFAKKSIPTLSSQSDIERTLAYLFTNFPHTFPDAAKKNKHFFKSSVKIIRTVLYS